MVLPWWRRFPCPCMALETAFKVLLAVEVAEKLILIAIFSAFLSQSNLPLYHGSFFFNKTPPKTASQTEMAFVLSILIGCLLMNIGMFMWITLWKTKIIIYQIFFPGWLIFSCTQFFTLNYIFGSVRSVFGSEAANHTSDEDLPFLFLVLFIYLYKIYVFRCFQVELRLKQVREAQLQPNSGVRASTTEGNALIETQLQSSSSASGAP